MADVYASAVGTTVLQIKEVPERPIEFQGEYNPRPYDERGWCVFEDAVSGELLARLEAFPRMAEALGTLPPKVLALAGGSVQPAEPQVGELAGRVDRVVARITQATFTGSGDRDTVPDLYKNYVAQIADALQATLALASDEVAQEALPPMPSVALSRDGTLAPAACEVVLAWHRDCLRAQHARIRDALSGRMLSTLDDCVPIAITGADVATGKALEVRDAAGLSEWLPTLRAPHRCALLTAGPAAGKTWLTSSVVVRALDGPLVPVLVKVEQLQKALGEHADAFAAAASWVDAHLALACAPAHAAALRQAIAARRALLVIDGLDEAGAMRERIECHVAEVLAPQGHVLLCTSRPAGLDEARFAAFHRLRLAPLSDRQQAAFLRQRLGVAREAELQAYVRTAVPVDADTQRRVTANPLMLSMVASIAELRTGVNMPRKTAELYEVATRAMLARSAAGVTKEAEALLQATFFEAHVHQQRIITEAHLAAAARRAGAGAAAAEAKLRELIASDQLPLVRLLEAEPLQMQAFHLSIQEFYAMRELRDRGGHLPAFKWDDAWWTNAVFMGAQTGDAFGANFAAAVGLAGGWRGAVVTALAREGLPAAWLPTLVEAAGGTAADVVRLRAFVGRHRDVLRREGGKAVAQLAWQEPDDGNVVIGKLRETPVPRVLRWRNKPQAADPCISTFSHKSSVNAIAVSRTRIVGGAGKAVCVYDAATEELLGTLPCDEDVKSVAVFEDQDGAGTIVAGGAGGTIKVWDAGAFRAPNRPSLA